MSDVDNKTVARHKFKKEKQHEGKKTCKIVTDETMKRTEKKERK